MQIRDLKLYVLPVTAFIVIWWVVFGLRYAIMHSQRLEAETPYQGHRTVAPIVERRASPSRIVPQGGESLEYRQVRALEEQARALQEIARIQKAMEQRNWYKK